MLFQCKILCLFYIDLSNKIVSSKNFSIPSEPIRFRYFTKLVGSQGKLSFKWLVG
ncbi:hypothetical protein LEP1GSC035_2828 [Leptospira noguchii str. 2007001578]|uniref:Uncharacterized protein n=1 Tax=Leptospira noguchii str. 2007001578 TaxID=1049974 RepID=A0ABN0J2D3_9LEPT|nr:hypothetical protein LEP1GSC035_3959 [Leptospira noguchii str. 2007001578]EMN01047.1 hypothetical protein LEP1GSC035_2828 [Leptospira noguchii str. 2007001578]